MSEVSNRRRSERVILRVAVVVLAEDEYRRQLREGAETQVVNAHGGLLKMRSHLHVGQSFLLNNPRNRMETSCRVVRVEEQGMEFYNIAFEFDRPAPNFWPVVFPPSDWVASAPG
jgi:hypothetical protein